MGWEGAFLGLTLRGTERNNLDWVFKLSCVNQSLVNCDQHFKTWYTTVQKTLECSMTRCKFPPYVTLNTCGTDREHLKATAPGIFLTSQNNSRAVWFRGSCLVCFEAPEVMASQPLPPPLSHSFSLRDPQGQRWHLGSKLNSPCCSPPFLFGDEELRSLFLFVMGPVVKNSTFIFKI